MSAIQSADPAREREIEQRSAGLDLEILDRSAHRRKQPGRDLLRAVRLSTPDPGLGAVQHEHMAIAARRGRQPCVPQHPARPRSPTPACPALVAKHPPPAATGPRARSPLDRPPNRRRNFARDARHGRILFATSQSFPTTGMPANDGVGDSARHAARPQPSAVRFQMARPVSASPTDRGVHSWPPRAPGPPLLP